MTDPAPPTPTEVSPDAIVIGAGSGGLTVAVGLAGLGKQVVLVEADDVGGDCTNVGCIPSKSLLHLARTGRPDALARTRKRRNDLRDEETVEIAETDGIQLLAGRASLVGAGEVKVASAGLPPTTLRAEHIVIATGSKPRIIDVPGLAADATPLVLLTNETLWDLPAPPEHLVIVGAGPIGMEMADAFNRLGSLVSIVEMADRVLANEDPEASNIVADAATSRGVKLHLGTVADRYDASAKVLHLGDGAELTGVDRVLMAVGRAPRTDGLGLERIGVALDRGGVATDDWGRTSVDGVWAVGDVTGRTHTTHGANAMGRRVTQAIGLPLVPRVGGPPTMPGAVFSDPELASVGLSMEELDRRYPPRSRHHLRIDMADIDRGYTDQVHFGAVIVDVQRLTGKILRATIVGPGAAEAIGMFTLAIDADISMHKLYRLVHPYPSYAGAIGKIADEFTRRTLPNLPSEAGAWLRSLPSRVKHRTK